MNKGYRQGDYSTHRPDKKESGVTRIEDILDEDQMKGVSSRIRQYDRADPSSQSLQPPSQSLQSLQSSQSSQYTEIPRPLPSQQRSFYPEFFSQDPGPINDPSNIRCRDISEHIKSCPICSKFFDTDKTLYIVIIFLLLILCVVLLKKVLQL